jgi:uncharacterized FlgJ-related protein
MDKIINDIDKMNQLSEEFKKELHIIYQKYKAMNEQAVDRQELKKRVDEILESMFKTAFSFAIPMDFINSPLGRMLFEIKLDIGNTMIYGFAELMIIADKSKQMIFHDYRNGHLVGVETGKKKRVFVTEEAVYEYITTVGRNPFTPEKAKKRIQTFNKMNRDGFSDDEIKTELCKIKK